jgi:hypothetical protein
MTEKNQIVFLQEQDSSLHKRRPTGRRHVKMTSRVRKLRVRSVISVQLLFQCSRGWTEKTMKNKKFWEELIAYFPMIRYGSHSKRRLQQF